MKKILFGLLFALQTHAAYINTVTVTGGTITANQGSPPWIFSLPTGAATSANQTTANGYLASIDSKLTSPVAVTGPLTDAQLRASEVPVSLATVPTHGVTQSGTWTTARSWTLSNATDSVNVGNFPATQTIAGTVSVSNFPATQPISAVSLPLPTGAATETTLAAINTKIPASPATDRTTAAAPFSIRLSDGSAFYNATTPADTQPISAASLPLPTGAATSANQTTIITAVQSIDTKIPTIGQKTMANSSPVVIASDQSAVPVSQSGTWTVQPGNTANTTAWLVKQNGSSFSRITTATTTVVKASPGVLRKVCLGTNNGNGHTITVYNNTTATGTILTLITTSGGSVPGNCSELNAAMTTGITVVTTGTSGWTVIYE